MRYLNLLVISALFFTCFFLVKTAVPAWIAILLSTSVPVVWCKLNPLRLTTGLVELCLKTYLDSRISGATHEVALRSVVDSRYPLQSGIRARITNLLPLAACLGLP